MAADDQNTEDTTADVVDETTETDEGTEETSETGATDETPADEWTPPTKEEWEQLQKAQKEAADRLTKVNRESADRRAKIRKLEQQNEDDSARAQREALEAAQARYKPIVAKSALLEANARTDRVSHLLTLMKMDRLEFDGNDEVVGLDIEVGRLQEECPEFFIQSEAPKPPAPVVKPAPKADVAPKKPAKTEPKTAGELIAARIMGTTTE
ncbi:phage scaffolding protein [Amycolatopsis sp. NPDC051373]|uniref:phage scaffolding protein n=1 Tax=Amycolatopsis sp. NPDC051373 TaxID=3155801 RepID=UPI00344E93D0